MKKGSFKFLLNFNYNIRKHFIKLILLFEIKLNQRIKFI